MERVTLREKDGNIAILNIQWGGEKIGEFRLTKRELQALNYALERLAAYEDTGMRPEEINTAKEALMGRELARIVEFDGIPIERLIELAKAEKDNALLKPEQLLELDGQPVWVVNSESRQNDGFHNEWALVCVRRKTVESVGTIYHFKNYFNTWLAYRRKPEEELQSGGDASGSSNGAHG